MFRHKNNAVLTIFRIRFSRDLRFKNKKALECLLLLSLGLLCKMDTVNELSTHLGEPKDNLYRTLRSLSLKQWHQLFRSCFEQTALEKLKTLQDKSASTWSRALVQLSGDDSVLRRYRGESLSFFGSWYSGQLSRVVKGHDIILVVLNINEEIIPVSIHIQSKKSPFNRTERMAKMVCSLAENWSAAGIEVKRIPFTADNGYCSSVLVETIATSGIVKFVLGGSKAMVVKDDEFTADESSIKLEDILTLENLGKIKENVWGIDEPMFGEKYYHTDLGSILVAGRKAAGKMRIAIAIGIDRNAEVYRVWKGHFHIEQLFRFLKSTVAWGKYRLRGKKGVMAAVMLPFVALAIAMEVKKSLKSQAYYIIYDCKSIFT